LYNNIDPNDSRGCDSIFNGNKSSVPAHNSINWLINIKKIELFKINTEIFEFSYKNNFIFPKNQ